MLKIKDNVDLKELEKFGFVPKYSETTGELVEMRRTVQVRNRNYKHTGATVVKQVTKQPKNFWTIFKRSGRIEPYLYLLNLETIDYEILYDLIQAGLVEKVEE